MPQKLKTSLPILVIVLLAALAVPRVVMHDLHTVPLDSPIYLVFAIVPFAIWMLFALSGRSKRPIYDFMVLGIIFGLMLAITHQLTWDASWGSNPPQLQGNLDGKIDPAVEGLLLRAATFVSSFMTGVVVGGITAAIAWAATRVRRHSARKK